MCAFSPLPVWWNALRGCTSIAERAVPVDGVCGVRRTWKGRRSMVDRRPPRAIRDPLIAHPPPASVRRATRPIVCGFQSTPSSEPFASLRISLVRRRRSMVGKPRADRPAASPKRAGPFASPNGSSSSQSATNSRTLAGWRKPESILSNQALPPGLILSYGGDNAICYRRYLPVMCRIPVHACRTMAHPTALLSVRIPRSDA